MEDSPKNGTAALDEAARSRALERFRLIRPFIDDGVPLAAVARSAGISQRTARHWVERYRRGGLTGLARKSRQDKSRPRIPGELLQVIEGITLGSPRPSAATIYRNVAGFGTAT